MNSENNPEPLPEKYNLAAEAAKEFLQNSTKPCVEILGEGNINETYLVRTNKESFVLQRINEKVFPQPELIVSNGFRIAEHIKATLGNEAEKWTCISCLATREGKPLFHDDKGGVWRAQTYLEETVTYPEIVTLHRARQVGSALGHFHLLLRNMATNALHEPLPDFHNLPLYKKKFDVIRGNHSRKISRKLTQCFEIIDNFPFEIDILEEAAKNNLLTTQVIHGDPKADNFLFRIKDDSIVALIDLDTVGPGLLHYDIGDCLRSCCNSFGERGNSFEMVTFDMDLCRAILNGYFTSTAHMLTEKDRGYIFEAVALITFELGLRFLTDYLVGNRYFKVHYEEENLKRAFLQFHLVINILEKEREIRDIL